MKPSVEKRSIFLWRRTRTFYMVYSLMDRHYHNLPPRWIDYLIVVHLCTFPLSLFHLRSIKSLSWPLSRCLIHVASSLHRFLDLEKWYCIQAKWHTLHRCFSSSLLMYGLFSSPWMRPLLFSRIVSLFRV